MKMESIQNNTNSGQLIELSMHAVKRSSQRGISFNLIQMMVDNGDVIYKQGLKYFYMTQDTLKYFEFNMQDQLRNLVVLVAGDSNTVITCYKNEKALKQIKQKSKRLVKYPRNRRNFNN